MSLDGYQLRSQLGAGRDGIAFRAIAADGSTTALVVDLARVRADSAALGQASSAAEACRAARSPVGAFGCRARSGPGASPRGARMAG